MAETAAKERSLEETPTWAVAIVCLVMIVISVLIEHAIHMIEKWFKKIHKPALAEALEKIKAELMLMGFISLLLTALQGPISEICISESVASTWHPCNKQQEETKAAAEEINASKNRRRLLRFLDGSAGESTRRFLAAKSGADNCPSGKVPFVSAYGIDQLHYFIFVLAVVHILYCIITYILGSIKMRKWKAWEDETKTIEYQYHNDPERFRFARDTSFGRRHMNLWSRSPVFVWIVCFFRQFFGSVTKVDYLTLRHGFITAHLAPGSETKFDFQKYIKRSLEDDFKVVVGITPTIWFVACLLLLTSTHGWYAYLWLPFIPLIIILVIGAKLQVIITRMGLRIQERGDVVKGAPVVEPGDDLFWFGRPRLILFLIHLCLFQNAFQLAFFAWSVWKIGPKSCYHDKTEDIVIKITMGVIIQVLCSYVTLPLYALVTQMGSSMRPTIFNDRVAAALKNWHHTAKKHAKHSKHSENHTPMSSRPTTPTYGMSPVHLLHNYRISTAPDSSQASPRNSNHGAENWDPEALNSVHNHEADEVENYARTVREENVAAVPEPSSMELPPAPGSIRTQHEVGISVREFTFRKG
ncbi:MLO-like protein 12 [Ricinus communis]|uniref:MLO-like protein n=1 Tax=Ricinus communis TaxID=3988 RepID=B9T4S7_RICCO|nr:MLO-like protein 12 [Ricinus communis]EEF29131.1 Protein MLO, putative [Ricinus communis]|eukprot:XP_002533246.1 MLO-like protein 12 [Ricinus communis]